MARTPKKQLAGFYAKAISVPAGGAVTHTIPAGFFTTLPVIGHTIQSTGAANSAGLRDFAFRLGSLVLNADKSVTLTGQIRRSYIQVVLGDPFMNADVAVTLHLTEMESD